MNRARPAVLAVFCLVTGLSPARPQNTESRLTIGTWNIEWLGTQSQRTGTTPRTAEDLRAIATSIADVLDIEVIVLVEINPTSQEWATVRDALAGRGYQFIVGSGGNQRIVIAYDDDEVDLLDSPEPVEPDVPTEFSRPDTDGSGHCETSNARKPPALLLASSTSR